MARRQATTASLIFLLLMMGIFLLPLLFYRPQPPPPVPEEVVKRMFEEAEKLEKENRWLSVSEVANIYGEMGMDKQIEKLEKEEYQSVESIQVAMEIYEEIAKKYPLSEEAPYALLRLGEIYQKRFGDEKKASAYYTRLEHEPFRNRLIEIKENGEKITLPANELALRRMDEMNRDTTLYNAMDFLVRVLGKNPSYSYVLALVLLVLLVRLPLLPLTNAQFKYMKKMQDIQPLLVEVQRKYRNDPRRLQKETARIFREGKVNPFGGCLLSIIQLPIFFLPYFMIRLYAYQFNKIGFLWIKSLAQPDLPLFVIYVVSLFLSMWLTSPSDPQQRQQSMMMSIMMLFFFIMFFRFLPSAFIFYWLLLNIATTVQQWLVMKKTKPSLQKVR